MRHFFTIIFLSFLTMTSTSIAETNSRVPDHLVQERYNELRSDMKKYPTNSVTWIKMNQELNDIRGRLNGLQKKDSAALRIIKEAYSKSGKGRLLPAVATVGTAATLTLAGGGDANASINARAASTVGLLDKRSLSKDNNKDWATEAYVDSQK